MRYSPFKVHPRDVKYAPVDADPDFDPKRNEAIVNKTMKDAETYWLKKRKAFNETLRERTDATASYLKSLDQGGKANTAEEYFGKHELARLRGLEIIKLLKNGVEKGEKLRYKS